MKSLDHKTTVVAILIILSFFFPFLCMEAEGSNEGNHHLESGQFKEFDADGPKGEGSKFKYEFYVYIEEGNGIDVYLLTDGEWEKYRGNQSFTAVRSWLNTTGFKAEWEKPDDDDYWLVADNWDNANDDDTQPSGNVTYDIKNYWDGDDEGILPGFEAIMIIPAIGITLYLRKMNS